MKLVKTIAVTIVLTTCFLFILYYLLTHRNPVEISLEHLTNILSPGTYEGTGYYTPTGLYPNGLNTNLYRVISKSNSGLTVVTNIKAYDAKTNKFAYNAIREGRFDYKPSHGNEVFINSLSYLGNNDNFMQNADLSKGNFDNSIISSSHGHSTGKLENRLSFSSTGSWYISKQNFIHIQHNITKISPTKFVETHSNKSMFEIPLITMTETYTKTS